MRRNFWYLTITLVVIVGAFVGTLASGKTPVLGLDLQGGISVVLAPVGDVKNQASLNKAVDIIRNRVDSLGVAEPEISRQGSNVIIDLPGVRDRDKARRLVGKTAELRFRPVLALLPAETKTTTTTKSKSKTSTTTAAAVAGATTSSSTATTTTTNPLATSTPAQDKADATVILPLRKQDGKTPVRYQLGPAALTGKGVSGAKAQFLGGSEGWVVDLSLKGDGATAFNQLAKTSYPKSPPENAVAIVLDGVVQSAPAFQTDSFNGDVQISGNFSEGDAKDLATVLQYGALPVQLKAISTQSVSPSLGTDQLQAGIAAGVIGLALVALYMLLFYRILGLVVIAGLILAGMAIYSLISYLGAAIGLTLTLAGVTGLIVSVGVTVDSYVVYFEKLKDEVRTGRTVRSSVDRAFEKSFKTILAADLVSLIGAAVLYALAIGSVRGFAFFLGISVILDLLISYFFMHPLVYFMVQRSELVAAKKVGIAAGLDAAGVVA